MFNLLACFGLTYFLKESDAFSKIRGWLISLSPLFYHLFSCYFCTGFWAGVVIYAMTMQGFSICDMMVNGFASAATALVGQTALERFSSPGA